MTTDIDAVVFDILGTMVDEPGGLERAVRSQLPDLPDGAVREVAGDWLAYTAEQQREMLTGRRPYADSAVLDLEAASRAVSGAGLRDDAARSLAAAALRLDPWPDSVSGLARIASRFPVVGLSNASRSALVHLNAHAGLRWHLVLSAQDVQSYKPDPDVYRLAATATGCVPERLLMVAAHAWDLRGAQAVGLRTAYVARPVGDPPCDDAFDLTASSLEDLAGQLGAG
jgi:2-haloacid dehalogenase